jgi:transcriptional regulator of heat shock response
MEDNSQAETATEQPERELNLEDLQHLANELKQRLKPETLSAFKKMLETKSAVVRSVVKDGLRIMVHPEAEPTKE